MGSQTQHYTNKGTLYNEWIRLQHLKPLINPDITKSRTTGFYVPPSVVQNQEYSSISAIFLPKIGTLV